MHFYVPPWLRHGRKRTKSSVFSVDVEPFGHRLASAGQDCTVKIWSLSVLSSLAVPLSVPTPPVSETPPANALLATISSHSSAVNCVRWAPQGSLLASAGDDAVVLIYEQAEGEASSFGGGGGLENWRVRRPLRGHAGDVTDVCWSPDGQRLASASIDNIVYVWCLRTERAIAMLQGHTGLVKGVAWDPVGRYLASQSDDRTVRIWRTSDWKCEKVISKPFELAVFKENSMAFYLRISWSPCGGHLLATNAYKKPGAHHAPMFGREKAFEDQIEFVGHREPVVSTRFSPRLYRPHPKQMEELRKEVEKENMEREGEIGFVKRTLPKGDETYTCMALGSKDCGATIWKAAAQRPFFDMAQMFDSDVIDLSWGTDGYTLVSCSTDGKVMYLRFDAEELGTVVSKEETRTILTNRWREFGGGGDSSAPIIESAAQLNLEAAEEENCVALEKMRQEELERKRQGELKRMQEEGRAQSEEELQEEVAHEDNDALNRQREQDSEQHPTPISPQEVPATPPADTEHTEQIHANGPTPPREQSQQNPTEIEANPDLDRVEVVEETLDSEAFRGPQKAAVPISASEKRSNLPEPIAAVAAAVRENGPTPPADPRIMAAQAEVRVKGGKRRITPMAVTSAPGAARPPLPSHLPATRPGAFDSAPNGVMASGESPWKRPRINTLQREVEVSRDSIQSKGNNPFNANGNNVPNGPSMALPQRMNSMFPTGGQPVQHAAELYAPSVIGLSMMLLPDRGEGPGRCRVISDGTPRVILESREQHGNGGGYVVMCSRGGEVQWRDYHAKSSPVTSLAGIAKKYAVVGTGDGMLFVYSAVSGRRMVPPIVIDSAPHMLEAFCITKEDPSDISAVISEAEKWYIVLVSRSALCTVFDVKAKKLICARSAAPLLARPAEVSGKAEGPHSKGRLTREISLCKVTGSGEPILILSDGHSFVYSRDFCSWLRVADNSTPNSDYVRTLPSPKKAGLLRSLQPGNGLAHKSLPTLSGMADLQRSAVESLSHLESLMESAIVLRSPVDYRYYLANYATRIAAAVSDDVENCVVRLRELCDSFLNSSHPSRDTTVLGMSCRGLLRDTILPVAAANRQMQRFVAEYTESLMEIERLSKLSEQSA